MTETTKRLDKLILSCLDYISKTSEVELAVKPSPEKWSEKEIIGHLIDSGINNLQRFTEIQFESKPYKIRKYNQDELVKTNDYQNSEMHEIMQLWLSINERILKVLAILSEDSLNYKIELEAGKIKDFRFLIKDYVDHLEHHLNQIIKK